MTGGKKLIAIAVLSLAGCHGPLEEPTAEERAYRFLAENYPAVANQVSKEAIVTNDDMSWKVSFNAKEPSLGGDAYIWIDKKSNKITKIVLGQ